MAYVADVVMKNEVDSYLSALNSFISKMQEEKQEIDKRIAKLKRDKHHYDQHYVIVQQLTETSNGLSQLHACLSKASNCLYKHKKYFALSYVAKNIEMHYNRELNSLSQHNFNENFLHAAIMSQASSTIKYPYLIYANQIDKDCNKLHKSLAGEYPALNYQSNNILKSLEMIKGYVFVSDRYMRASFC